MDVAKAMTHSAAVSFMDNKKKFPDSVTNVRPIAMMPTSAASLIIVLKLNHVRKFGAVTIPATNTNTSTATIKITSGE
jgi:hypothetical protein